MTRALLLIAALSVSAVLAQTYSPEKEQALGRQLLADIESRSPALNDAVISAYFDRLGDRLTPFASLPYPLVLRVLDGNDDIVSALPGGYVLISSALAARIDTEAELAGLLAHEIAHVAARHVIHVQMLTAPIPLVFMGSRDGVCVRMQRATPLIPADFLAKLRAFEEEADRLGVGYLAAAGYNPHGLPDAFHKVSPNQAIPPVELPAAGPNSVVTTSTFQEIRARLAAHVHRAVDQDAPPHLRRN